VGNEVRDAGGESKGGTCCSVRSMASLAQVKGVLWLCAGVVTLHKCTCWDALHLGVSLG
jgi:hypothetical protein